MPPLFARFENVFDGLPGMAGVRFGIANKEAEDWYVPLKPYVRLEYDWVLRNVKGEHIVDAGSHHGNYSLVLAALKPKTLDMVDPVNSNCRISEGNMEENFPRMEYLMWEGALWDNVGEVGFSIGDVGFSGQTNGLVGEFEHKVACWPLRFINPDADVVKLDIEGSEYSVLPSAVDMPKIHTWIIEAHLDSYRPHNGDGVPDDLARLLLSRGFELLWINRHSMKVEPYQLGTRWDTHSTLIGRR